MQVRLTQRETAEKGEGEGGKSQRYKNPMTAGGRHWLLKLTEAEAEAEAEA